jgi:catechol 2,3-dioxygenase-like lactoylglutathione lyase family enzyme
VDPPILDGPRAPESVPAPPEQRVNGLIPFVHVRDVARSIAFYHHLGFIVTSIYKYRGSPAWAELQSEGAVLMVTTGDPVDQVGQGILFYLYSTNLAALREQLLAAGIDVGEIVDGTPGPREEMRLTDPDGYVLMVAQIEPPEPCNQIAI